jgi:hypothetical protein
MSQLPRVYIEGLAFWSPTLPSWSIARAAFRGEATELIQPLKRPAPELLQAAEARRAPDTVVLALEVAAQAVAQSAQCVDELLSVFTSAHGDLAITDHLCSVLAATPTLLSPTKFHHSVHNAPSGYWTMSTHCMQATTAVSAFDRSFAAGLLEALVHCVADYRPVLLVGYDIAARGTLATINESRGLLGLALVLAPEPSVKTCMAVDATLIDGAAQRSPLRSAAAQSLTANAMADGLPLFETLANDNPALLLMPVSTGLTLALQLALAS